MMQILGFSGFSTCRSRSGRCGGGLGALVWRGVWGLWVYSHYFGLRAVLACVRFVIRRVVSDFSVLKYA